ncbi:hypothetical protein M2401_001091 [Pseudomonas sp. JUb42]|uniref:hypothetical protein n=1 Tax=Pseudomonas sp. JUb42 TaxID=2940611 RepID=UPI002168AED2|nr:hypothetical protein [Pseudomonas sp. JUb42]MCS3467370.1 hypothetical protein [Pseudomonas sp. JUb42]
MEIISDMKFWALIVSLASFIISILPAIRNRWKGRKLTIETQDGVMLSHKWGYTNLKQSITLINNGGVTIRVKDITITLKRDGSSSTIPVRNFFRTFDAQFPSLFSSISLKPGEETTHTFGFHHKLKRIEEKAMSEIISAARREIAEPTIGTFTTSPQILMRPTLSPKTLDNINKIFSQNFYLTCGEYEMEMEMLDENRKCLASKSWRFTIFETDESNLRDITKNYSTGDGVIFDSNAQTWFYMGLT